MKTPIDYFKHEMEYLKKQQAQFAKEHPDIAARLYLGTADADPFVEKIIQATAFLTGRIQKKLDHQYENISKQLLETTTAFLTRPIPSQLLLRFQPLASLNKMVFLEKHTEVIVGHNERHFIFQTDEAFPIVPLKISYTQIIKKNILSICVEKISEKAIFQKEEIFQIHASISLEYSQAALLYFCLQSNETPFQLSFDENLTNTLDEKIDIRRMPSPRIDSAESLLIQFHHFPESFFRFQFNLPASIFKNYSKIYLWKSHDTELELFHNDMNNKAILLNCIRCTNDFTRSADPISIRNMQLNYPLSALEKNPVEIIEIQNVAIRNTHSKEKIPTQAFLQNTQNMDRPIYWNLSREEKNYITLEDPHRRVDWQSSYSLNAELLCSDGAATSRLRYQPEKLDWKLAKNTEDYFSEIKPASIPTLFCAPSIKENDYSNLFFILQSARSSLFHSENALAIFKSYLGALDHSGNSYWKLLRENMAALHCSIARILDEGELVSGIEVVLTWSKNTKIARHELFLFEHILETVFDYLKPINTKIKFYAVSN